MSSNRPFNLHLDVSPSALARQTCIALSLIFISLLLWRVIASERQLGFAVLIIMLGVGFAVMMCHLLCSQPWQRVHIHLLKQTVSLRCQSLAGEWQSFDVCATTDLGWLVVLHVRAESGARRHRLVVWRDSVSEADFRQLRALVRTGALFARTS